jgi:pyruvate dehydrogenase E1 component alpha subunit
MIRYKYKQVDSSNASNSYDKGFLLNLYREMLRIRIIQETIERHYHENEMKSPIHLVIGQEATSVGVCAALRKSDEIYSSHRTQGNYLAKGGSLKKMMSELFCRANGCVGSRGGSMHLLDKSVGMAGSSAIVGGVIPIATGAALSAQMLKEDRVTVAFLGDAATEEGAVWESFNFAALKKLPVIYVCENNFYSVCSSLEVRQPQVDIYKKAEAFGLKGVQIDGTRVLNVYEATREAVEHVKKGLGPVFIESIAYRFRGHGGAGDDSASGYRDTGEVLHWHEYCPVKLFSDYLRRDSLLDDVGHAAMKTEFEKEVLEAFDFAKASPNPEEKDLYTYLYSQ